MRLLSFPTLEQPKELTVGKAMLLEGNPTTFSDCPLLLLMDIVKMTLTGNWSLMKTNGMSVAISGFLGINNFPTFSLFLQ